MTIRTLIQFRRDKAFPLPSRDRVRELSFTLGDCFPIILNRTYVILNELKGVMLDMALWVTAVVKGQDSVGVPASRV